MQQAKLAIRECTRCTPVQAHVHWHSSNHLPSHALTSPQKNEQTFELWMTQGPSYFSKKSVRASSSSPQKTESHPHVASSNFVYKAPNPPSCSKASLGFLGSPGAVWVPALKGTGIVH
mmetsp:Transcript_12269/g.28660  ORF Transcript_12269/g.28660 Transcript_12269/m.28660 type:complete len:118 (-) Transcript_12269:2881-3234(-)